MTDNICPGCGLENQGTELKCPSCVEHESVSQPSPRERIEDALDMIPQYAADINESAGWRDVTTAIATVRAALDEMEVVIDKQADCIRFVYSGLDAVLGEHTVAKNGIVKAFDMLVAMDNDNRAYRERIIKQMESLRCDDSDGGEAGIAANSMLDACKNIARGDSNES